MEVNQDFLLTDDISFSATVAFDHAPLGFLKYTVDCSLFEDGVTTAVDTTTFLDRTTFWDMAEVAFGHLHWCQLKHPYRNERRNASC